MFQYAMGRSMSLAKNTQLKLDIYSFEESNKRTFDLAQYKIQKQLANRQEIGEFKLPQNIIDRLLRPKNFVVEKETFVFNPRVLDLKGDSHLVGYWVHKNYLKKHLDVIVDDFTLQASLSPQAAKLKAEITSSNSLAIHVRLGDYHKDPQIKSMFQVCGPDYYKRALDHMHSKFPDLKVFVFSDDIEIAKQWLGQEQNVSYVKITDAALAPTIQPNSIDKVVAENAANGVNFFDTADHVASAAVCEFELMRACQHIIISNSTFSWWAAFLGDYELKAKQAQRASNQAQSTLPNSTRTVCVPNKWLNYKDVDLDAIIPDSWTRINVEA